MNKIRVAVLANASLGGTEKAATIYATQLASRGYEIDYLASPGPRTQFLGANGVNALDVGRSADQLLNYVRDKRPQVIHQHVPGYPTDSQLYLALDRIAAPERPKLIETNVFGRLEDKENEPLISFRMFISMASASQALRRARIRDPLPLLDRHTVMYYPVVASPQPLNRGPIRKDLGVLDDEVLAVRIGRLGHKWAAWECEAYAIAKRETSQLRLLMMEPPKPLAEKIASGVFGTGIIVKPETGDFEWLAGLYNAGDLMIHASDWGESFGYTIAEAMAAGMPVITRSTPWCDNAQVELVENGQTGFVCWSVPEMARRLVDLSVDQNLKERMGCAGRERILALADVETEIEILEEIIRHVLFGQPLSKVNARNRDFLTFNKNFSSRERNTSESFGTHPIQTLAGSLYAAYRCSRAAARAAKERMGLSNLGGNQTVSGTRSSRRIQ